LYAKNRNRHCCCWASITFSEELLGQLLEWSPTVITTPLVAEQINAYEIKIDAIIADELDEVLQSDVKQIPQGAPQTG
jgi:thiamine pyrophosphokinase